jgi:hypothetical protein
MGLCNIIKGLLGQDFVVRALLYREVESDFLSVTAQDLLKRLGRCPGIVDMF